MITLAHKIELDLNNSQESFCKKACGCSRFASNWALATWNELYKAGFNPNINMIDKAFNAIKGKEFPWMQDVLNTAPQKGIKNTGKAFQNFFDSQSGKRKDKVGYPQFKKKGRCKDSFYIPNSQLKVDGKKVYIPRLGWVRMHQELRFVGKIMSATVSRMANRWFISISVQMPDIISIENQNRIDYVGADLGIKTLATLSTGEKFDNPKPLQSNLKKLRRLNKSMSRKIETKKVMLRQQHPDASEKTINNMLGKVLREAKNFQKVKQLIQIVYAKIANIRKDTLHQITSYLLKNFSCIAIEDLNVSGMKKNRKLSRVINDVGFGEFRRQLEYKAPIYGCQIFIVDQFFPSSKMCFYCDELNENLTLGDREWQCDNCQTLHDRDVNASYNLETAGRISVEACGELSAGSGRRTRTKLSSMKQEPVGSQ